MSPSEPPAAPGDEVDLLVEAWTRLRPELADGALAPLQVMSRVARLARHLDRARRGAFATCGLDVGEFDVLATLRRADADLSPGALQRATVVASGTMTHRLDKLEAAGLVARGPDPGDGRGVRVRLTSAGRERVDAALDALLNAESAVVTALGARGAADLAQGLRRLLIGYESPGSPAAG